VSASQQHFIIGTEVGEEAIGEPAPKRKKVTVVKRAQPTEEDGQKWR
jgi:hypothetical protein